MYKTDKIRYILKIFIKYFFFSKKKYEIRFSNKKLLFIFYVIKFKVMRQKWLVRNGVLCRQLLKLSVIRCNVLRTSVL